MVCGEVGVCLCNPATRCLDYISAVDFVGLSHASLNGVNRSFKHDALLWKSIIQWGSGDKLDKAADRGRGIPHT